MSMGFGRLAIKGGGTIRPSGDTLDNNISFIEDVDQRFWSASTRSFDPDYAWYVGLNDGPTNRDLKTAAFQILCVVP